MLEHLKNISKYRKSKQNQTITNYLLHEKQILKNTFLFLFLRSYLFIFLERGEGRERKGESKREGEKPQCVREIIDWLPLAHPQLGTWPATQACALTGNQASDISVRLPALNPRSHTS